VSWLVGRLLCLVGLHAWRWVRSEPSPVVGIPWHVERCDTCEKVRRRYRDPRFASLSKR